MKKLYVIPQQKVVLLDADGTTLQATSLHDTSGGLDGVDNEGTGSAGIDWGNVKEENPSGDIDWNTAWSHITQ